MVITCPLTPGASYFLVVAVSTSVLAKTGLLIKNPDGFEQAREISAILFDKASTLTRGKFGVTDFIPLDGKMNEIEIIRYAASIENHSEHPMPKESYPQPAIRFQWKDSSPSRVKEPLVK